MGTREIVRIVTSTEVMEGAGVRLRRSIGSPQLDLFDPFLLLDEFKSDRASDYLAGFPDHPHRGFETVTYMLAGLMEHQDHVGNRGRLGPGSVQWMTAGRGIVHSEMPRQQDGLMWGFQLWVNLPAKDKLCAPRYQDIPGEKVPVVELRKGVTLRVLVGEAAGARGPVSGIVTDPLYLDVALAAEAGFDTPITAGHNAFVYVFEGTAQVGERSVKAGELALLGDGESLAVRGGPGGARFLLLAARPLGEPVARYGPFVMNTMEEIRHAVRDFQTGRLVSHS